MARFVMSLLISIASYATADEDWKFIHQENNIKVFQKTHEGSPYIGMRGEAVLNHPLEQVFSILVNMEYRQDWIDRLKFEEILEEKNEGRQVTSLIVIDMPWPIKDREFLIKNTFSLTGIKGTLTSDASSISDSRWPADNSRVRGETNKSQITLTPIAENKTQITIIAQADPKGKIPAWVVNLFQRGWPVNTINKISSLLEQHPNVEVNPLYHVLLKNRSAH